MSQDIHTLVRGIVREKLRLGPDEPTPPDDARLRDYGDSIQYLEILAAVEDEFRIFLRPEEFESVGDLVAVVKDKAALAGSKDDAVG